VTFSVTLEISRCHIIIQTELLLSKLNRVIEGEAIATICVIAMPNISLAIKT